MEARTFDVLGYGSILFYFIFNVFVIVLVTALIIFLVICFFLSLYRKSYIVTAYFGISILLEGVRIVGRVWVSAAVLLGFFFEHISTATEYGIYFFDFAAFVDIFLDNVINGLLVFGVLLITHNWLSAVIKIALQRKHPVMRFLASIIIFFLYISVQCAVLLVVAGILLISAIVGIYELILVSRLINCIVNAILYAFLCSIFVVVGMILSSVLNNVYFVGSRDKGAFVRGSTEEAKKLSKKVLMLSLSIASYFFVGAMLMVFYLITAYPEIIRIFDDYSVLLSIQVKNSEIFRVHVITTFLTLYIFVFEFGLTGFISCYYIFKPDVGVTELPPINMVKDYDDLFDDRRLSGVDHDELLLDQIEDVEEDEQQKKLRVTGWNVGKGKSKSEEGGDSLEELRNVVEL